jgi:two-component system sensor histidine kinase UhpB
VTPQQTSHTPILLRDLAIVAAVAAGYFILAAHFGVAEMLSQFTGAYEPWQLDEVPLTLLVLSLGLCWFAARRVNEARRELIERIRAEAEIAVLLGHNRDLSQRLILVQESERRALARELHDEFGQSCTAIRAEAGYILHAGAGDKAAVSASAQRIAGTAANLYELVRGMLVRLRPPALDSLGLESALQELCESWEEQTGIACGFFPYDVSSPVDDSASVAVFRLIQEALTNVARHAHASQVRIELRAAPDRRRLSLSIHDDGSGMPGAEISHAGFGIIGMRERVTALNGDIRFLNPAQGGLRIEVEIPLPAPNP